MQLVWQRNAIAARCLVTLKNVPIVSCLLEIFGNFFQLCQIYLLIIARRFLQIINFKRLSQKRVVLFLGEFSAYKWKWSGLREAFEDRNMWDCICSHLTPKVHLSFPTHTHAAGTRAMLCCEIWPQPLCLQPLNIAHCCHGSFCPSSLALCCGCTNMWACCPALMTRPARQGGVGVSAWKLDVKSYYWLV